MRRLLISLTLAFGALSTLTAESGIRKDELRCEEAKKHLQECCGFDSHLDCHYYEGGCDEQPTYPQLAVEQSECILSKDCSDLAVHGCNNPKVEACE
jgi:hypothetical protein